MTKIKTIKNATFAVTNFKDEFGDSHNLYQEIKNGKIEQIPHRQAVTYKAIEPIYNNYLDNQIF